MTTNGPAPVSSEYLDVHAHFSVPTSADERRRIWQRMLGEGIYFPEPFEWSVERTLAYMDASGTGMQLLSNIPSNLPALQASNDYAAGLVEQFPSRFGFLAALPTDDPEAAVAEAQRARDCLGADGFAVTGNYRGSYLGGETLAPLWRQLDEWESVVFVHPDARLGAVLDHPVPLYEVAFETARTVFDMMFRRTFQRYPGITFVVAHCGGAFPALTGRLGLLGDEAWVPQGISADDVDEQASRLYVDTAAVATVHALLPAIAAVGADHIVYGSDWGAPCTTEESAERNRLSLDHCGALSAEQASAVRSRADALFPEAARRRQGRHLTAQG
jgi:predicted TIM-barrel fold metal-dependent hydrolase